MPYGIPKDKGGDSKENVSKMERCVTKVMDKGKSQESAIRICKTSLFGGDGMETDSIVTNLSQTLVGLEVATQVKAISSSARQRLKQVIAGLMDLAEAGAAFEPRLDLSLTADGKLQLEAGERFAALIQRARMDQNLTISDLATKMADAGTPLTEGALLRMEQGYSRSKPPYDIMQALADALGLDLNTLDRAASLDFECPVESY